ncbi:PEX29 [Candida theae]|uniref:PEX29 n=1 Tax=Candida theae TaxID=1198502 RepID=A0AAD5BES8_9ASCO|nr:PEX29 [Candida theae]KAI5957766.1 PEX29 [Candida theae]
MESVTSLLGNILSLDDETKASNSNSNGHARSNVSQSTPGTSPSTPHRKRRSLDLDFSSFWKQDKEGSDDGDSLTTSKAKANATSSTTGTNATSSSGTGGATTSDTSRATTTTSAAGAAASTASAAAASTANVSSATSQNYYADKLMEKAISMIIPNEIYDDQTNKMLQDRQMMAKLRPPLSFALMQKNSNNLHQRNSDIYIFFNHVLKYVNWMDPYYTIGITLIITHMILKPVLFLCLPWFLVVVNTLIPHYLMIYPQDPTFNNEYLEQNPKPSDQALELAKVPKPVGLFSKEFFMNLTDTQNFMTLQSRVFDFQTWLFADYLYFKDEQISSVIVLGCLVVIGAHLLWFHSIVMFVMNHIWVVKILWVIMLWVFIILMHPNQRCKILSWIYEEDTRLDIQNRVNKIEDTLTSVLVDENLQSDLQRNNNQATNYAVAKLVEVYELQKLNQETKIWELVGFTRECYSINDGVRKYNHKIKLLNQEIARAQYKSSVIGGSAILDDLENHNDLNSHPHTSNAINVASTITETGTPPAAMGAEGEVTGGIGHEHDYIQAITSKSESISQVKPPQGYKYVPSSKWTIDYDVASWVQSNFIQDLVIVDDDEKWAYDVTIQNITIRKAAATNLEDDGNTTSGKWHDKNGKDDNDDDDDNDNDNDDDDDKGVVQGNGVQQQHEGEVDVLGDLDDGEIYRRRRWLRYVVRETYKDIDRPPVQQSHLASWVT